jgi:hypothetical protein
MVFVSRKTSTITEVFHVLHIYILTTQILRYYHFICQLSQALYLSWDLLSHFVLPQYTH